LHKFALNSQEWTERSQLIVGYDSKGFIVNALMNSHEGDFKEAFEAACIEKTFY
jgi:hypothetical protein